MYKAIDIRTNTAHTLLDQRSDTELEELRAAGRNNHLICQVCRSPVLVRAGTIRRRHFAHKVRADCPVSHESLALLQARALLYLWLRTKFDPASVTLEHAIPGVALPRPVDCWVNLPSGPIAYWLVEHVNLRQRDELRQVLEGAASHVQWVFLQETCVWSGNDVQLSLTQRELMRASPYEVLYAEPGVPPRGSLSFLDHETATLRTLRHLRLLHDPGTFTAHALQHPLEAMLVRQKTGGFAHPGEPEAYHEWKKQQEARAAQIREATPVLEDYSAVTLAREKHAPAIGTASGRSSAEPPTCEHCGTRTDNWWHIDKGTNTCQCNSCLRQGKYR
ncbi:MAG: hypothetical protein OHK0022_08740 [Roseiflexaceae bacterium]